MGIDKFLGLAEYIMRVTMRNKTTKAFALPTVLIASVVLLSILAVSVTATTAVRTALKNQYYTQLARVAGESGVAFAKACLADNGNIPLWTDAKPLTVTTDCSGNQMTQPSVQVLVVAGGGSGGMSNAGSGGGGGGGAGGVIYTTDVVSARSYAVTVGGGATAPVAAAARGNNGGNSVFDSFVAIGGGAGGGAYGDLGLVGGSGGGAGYKGYTFQAGAAGTVGQGNKGGDTLSNNNAGGGGGAGGAGGNTDSGGPSGLGGVGGDGLRNGISGTDTLYAKGGAGGSPPPSQVVANGAANTGNGGTGAYSSSPATSGSGGSGVVIISYPTGSLTATGGTVSFAGGNTIHTFKSSSTFTVSQANPLSCPTDRRCSLMVDGNVRSSFTVSEPTVDADGRALTIPTVGYVEVTRTSSGAVWRTYKQPSTPAAVSSAPRNVNIAPDFSQWTLSGGATYDYATGRVTLPPSGVATSPLIYVGMPRAMSSGGDFYAASPSSNSSYAPQGAFNYGIKYFQSNRVTSALNTAGFTVNGCATVFALNSWADNQSGCSWTGGPDVAYVILVLYGSDHGYASPNMIVRNPILMLYN